MNLPSATDLKDGFACETLQSLEIRINALDWNMLLRDMVKEEKYIILSYCEFW